MDHELFLNFVPAGAQIRSYELACTLGRALSTMNQNPTVFEIEPGGDTHARIHELLSQIEEQVGTIQPLKINAATAEVVERESETPLKDLPQVHGFTVNALLGAGFSTVEDLVRAGPLLVRRKTNISSPTFRKVSAAIVRLGLDSTGEWGQANE